MCWKLSRAEVLALAFTLAYMTVWLGVSLALQNSEFVFYFVVMCLLIVAVGVVHLRVRFPIALLWGLAVWGLAHMAGGLMPIPASWPAGGESRVLYNWWFVPGLVKYDHAAHAYGFGLVTWACWHALQRLANGHGGELQPTLGVLVFCVAGGMGFGAANELVEFLATVALPETNVGGYMNTGWDLVSNFVGCLVAAAVIWGVQRRW